MKTSRRITCRTSFIWLAILFTLGLVLWHRLSSPLPSAALITHHNRLIKLAQDYSSKSTYDLLIKRGNFQAARNEAERLANWKKNFPWQPTTDPDVKFDPIRHIRQGPPPGERDGFVDPTISEYHVFLKRFFQNEARFSAQFEQMYLILSDYGKTNNPVIAGRLYQDLWSYNQMAQHDPDEAALEALIVTHRWVDPHTNEIKSETRLEGWEVVRDVQSGRVRTWGDEADRCAESMLGRLTTAAWLGPDMSFDDVMAQAQLIRSRLIAEIQGMGSIPHPKMYGEISPEEEALGNSYLRLMREGRPAGGDEILVPYVGWVKGYREYEDKFYARLNHSIAAGDPSLKAIRPDLFPPAGVKNNLLVDQHGDPVHAHPGLTATMINENGDVLPLILAEDGSIQLPTPTDIEALKSEQEPAPVSQN